MKVRVLTEKEFDDAFKAMQGLVEFPSDLATYREQIRATIEHGGFAEGETRPTGGGK